MKVADDGPSSLVVRQILPMKTLEKANGVGNIRK